MEWETLTDIHKHFEEIEALYSDGNLSPSSVEGQNCIDEMLLAITQLSHMAAAKHHLAKGGDIHAAECLLDIVDMRSRLALLLGKFEGFKYGVKHTVARMGKYNQYLN